jgi:MFS family permease
MYTGMGLAGIAMGCTYVPPIQALIEWFPDRKGLASGATVAGFGSGALFFAPVMTTMADKFSWMPTFVGSTSQVQCQTIDGKLFADLGGQLKEVVLATGKED